VWLNIGMSIFQDVIKLAGGTQKALASALGVSDNAVSKWRINNQFPTFRAIQIEEKFGIDRSLIRPDYFKKPITLNEDNSEECSVIN